MPAESPYYHRFPLMGNAGRVLRMAAFAWLLAVGSAFPQSPPAQASLRCNGAVYAFTPQGGRIAVTVTPDPESPYGPMLPVQTAQNGLREVILDFPRGGQTSLSIVPAPSGYGNTQSQNTQDAYDTLFTLSFPGGVPLAFISGGQSIQGEIILPQFSLPAARATIISQCGSSASLELNYSIWEYEPLWPYVIVP